MSKHMTAQRYVYKIHSSRLRRAKWDLTLSLNQARENKELIALNESQLMRFIDELNEITNPEIHISEIQAQIKALKKEKNLAIARPKIKELYAELDKYQFKKDYVCVIVDTTADYTKMYKHGFQLNKITYRRLLGTTNGVKNNTIIFINEKLLPELKHRIDNGRNMEKEFTPAKLEAYKSLVCSSSTPVSNPKGIVVVHDCVTHFTSDVIELDDTGLEQPRMKYIKNKEIALTDSDGYGLAMPSLMERWGQELGEDFLLPACVIRNSFCKGSVFPVDFRQFAKEHGFTHITDVWGNTYEADKVELVLTESMLKLWDSYASLEDYLEHCRKNHYTFAVTKSSGDTLENERTMNYQFLQSYDFTGEQIDELIAPTVDEIQDILSYDYRKTILYTKGIGLNEKNVQHLDASFSSALMIEPKMMNDPFVKQQIYTMIQKRIDRAKVGVLKVPANYSIVSGDPYSLCQSMFGLEVTGLLKEGQVYSKYWIDKNIKKIVSFRAPMTAHNNIRLLEVAHNEKMEEFYKYMTTPTIFNSWDTCADAMNGMDKDGDAVINTSFPLLVNNTRKLPAILCVQRKAPKCIPDEAAFMQSNINSFGNAVGEVTNRITAMFEVQSRYPKDSREYRLLDYRIKCGQLYQQNSIDKTKGIEANDMPDKWYRRMGSKAALKMNSAEKKENWLNGKLLADKKPYFMIYIYPKEKAVLHNYIKATEEKCYMRFRISLKELLEKKERTSMEENFVQYFYHQMPVGTAPCTINKICWKMEKLFDDITFLTEDTFDYSILKSDENYSKEQYHKIKKIYDSYKKELLNYMTFAKSERIKPEDRQLQKYLLKEQFQRLCLEQCPNEEALCNIVLDLCYSKSKNSKQFAWDICGDIFIRNLLKRKDYMISYPVLDKNGDIDFGGMKFSMKTTKINTTTEDSICPLF